MNTIKRIPGMIGRVTAYVLATAMVVIISVIVVLTGLLKLLF